MVIENELKEKNKTKKKEEHSLYIAFYISYIIFDKLIDWKLFKLWDWKLINNLYQSTIYDYQTIIIMLV